MMGDAILLAFSVSHLGVFQLRQRNLIRMQIVKGLLEEGIRCSSCWKEENDIKHTKLFKQLISQLCGKECFIQVPEDSHPNILSELLFNVIITDKVPLVYDSSAIFQSYLTRVFLSHHYQSLRMSEYIYAPNF